MKINPFTEKALTEKQAEFLTSFNKTLQPCPFCGRPAMLKVREEPTPFVRNPLVMSGLTYYKIICPSCFAETKWVSSAWLPDIKKAWNYRKPREDLRELVGTRIRKYNKFIKFMLKKVETEGLESWEQRGLENHQMLVDELEELLTKLEIEEKRK